MNEVTVTPVMTGHTKEPWVVSYYHCRANADDVAYERNRKLERGETRRDLKVGDLLWRQPLSIGEIAPDDSHWAGNCLSCDEDTAERVCALWNAFAGIENPAAFVEAARGMMEAAELLCDPHIPAGHDRWDALRRSTRAFRAQIGEA